MLNRTFQWMGIVVLIAVFILAGCGPKPIQKESLLDTPQNHYKQGLRELNNGNLTSAAQEFDRAIALDPKYPGGYVGKALVANNKKNYENALEWVDKAIDRDDKYVDAFVAKGIILTDQRKGDNWLDKAVKEFDKALKLKPESEKALFYKGMAYKNAYEFGNAADQFKQVIALKGEYSQMANDQWELMQKIQRAAPGSKIGMKIALMDKIDRADLAVLFVEELKLLEVFEKKRPKEYDTRFRPPTDPTAIQTQSAPKVTATDIEGHWAKSWIENIIKAGAMDNFPDGGFHPDDLITRANYAIFLQNILVTVTGDDALATKYIGSPARFPDVNPSHYAYNAICLVVDRGIMKADTMDGAFGMSKSVSGADALLIIREFQNALRMTF